jgi:hypothetical protein
MFHLIPKRRFHFRSLYRFHQSVFHCYDIKNLLFQRSTFIILDIIIVIVKPSSYLTQSYDIFGTHLQHEFNGKNASEYVIESIEYVVTP